MNSILLRRYIIVLVLFLVVCAAYLHTLDFPFQFDDQIFIVQNVAIRDIGNTRAIWNAVLHQPSRFIGFLSFALNYHVHGLNIRGYRIANIGLHFLNGVLVLLLFRQILETPRFAYLSKEQRLTIAGLGAVLFCAHPLQTQAVTYLSQRFASLATFFYLSALLCYFQARSALSKRFRLLSGAGCICLGLLGMFTKEIVITLPLMIMFFELAFLKRRQERYSPREICLFTLLIAAGLCIIPALFSFKTFSMLTTPRLSASHDGDVITFWPYVWTQSRVWLTYLRLFICPVGQNIDHDFMLSPTLWHVPALAGVISIVVLLLAGIASFPKRPWLGVGVFWFLISLSASLVPRRHVIFEHKMYLASIGLCFVCAYLLAHIRKGVWRKCVCAVMVVFLVGLTYKRNLVWRSEISLWEDAARQSPQKYRPVMNLSSALIRAGRYPEALKYAERAVRLNPQQAEAYNNRGVIYYKQKKWDQALREHDQAVRLNPDHFKYYHDRGVVYKQLGQYDRAFQDFSRSIGLKNNNAKAFRNRGDIYFALKQYKLAVKDYDKALFVQADYAEAYNNRGLAHSALKDYAKALKDFEDCARIDPAFADAYNNAAFVFLKKGQLDQAVKYLSQAVKINPRYAEAYANRAMIYRKQRRYDLALQDIQQALTILPQYQQALDLKGKIQQDLVRGQGDVR